MLLGKLCKVKEFKNTKLAERLLKNKQNREYLLQSKLKLLCWKEQYDSLIAKHKDNKNHHKVVSKRYHWPYMKNDINHIVKLWEKCHLSRASYQKQTIAYITRARS